MKYTKIIKDKYKKKSRELLFSISVLLIIIGVFYIPFSNLSNIKYAAAAAIGDGVIIYDQTTPTTDLQERSYEVGTDTVSAASSPFAGSGTSKHIRMRSSATRDEILLGVQDSAGVLTIYKKTAGGTWASQWSVTVGDGNLQRFDIAYEETSGDALVVYSGNTAVDGQELKYNTWDGASWGGATNLGSVRTTGTVYGVKLVSRTTSGTNDIGLVYADTNFDLSANVWTGAAWYGEPSAALATSISKIGTATEPTTRSYDLAFESLSGDLMVIWGIDATADPRYVIKAAGGAWGSTVTATALIEEPTNVDISSSPISDKIAYVNTTDNGGDSDFAIWSGSAWGTGVNDTTSATPVVGESGNNVEWIVDGANEVAIYTYNDNQSSRINWYTSTNGGQPTLQTDDTTAPVFGVARFGFAKSMSSNPAKALFAFGDSNSDIFIKEASLSGTTVTWSNVGLSAAIETNSSVAGYNAVGLTFVKYITPVTTISDGTDPSNLTIAPGTSATEIDRFSLVTNTGTDTVTGLTVTLGPASAYTNIDTVDIQTTAGVSKCSAIPSSNTVLLTTCAIAVTTASTEYKIMITPKTHANMAAVPGASYATVGTVTFVTASNSVSGTDTDSATITIDNTSPGEVSSATVSAGDTFNTLSWTNPVDTDFSKTIVLKREGNVVTDVPTEGTTYATSTVIGSSEVACIGAFTTCNDLSLTNGTAYYYKIFALDSNGNFSATGVVPTGSPATPADTAFTQSVFRFFSSSMDVPLVAENSAGTLTSAGQSFRLRQKISVDTAPSILGAANLKLQYAAKSGTCDPSFNGEVYADIDSNSLIAFNASGGTDNSLITSTSTDPTSARDAVYQTLETINNFTNSIAAVPTGDDGIWEFSLLDNGAPSETSYCIRVVRLPKVLEWTSRTAPEVNGWQDITYGNDKFVAIANTGTNKIMTSPDGFTWTARSTPVQSTWYALTYGNGRFVAVGSAGDVNSNVITSTDGITWATTTSVGTNAWNNIIYANNQFVAVAQNAPLNTQIMTSPDGLTWTARTGPSSAENWRGVAYGNGRYVAVSLSGTDRIMTSTDSITWATTTAPALNTWLSVAFGNNTFVAVSIDGTNQVMTSTDGLTWTLRSAASVNTWVKVFFAKGLFIALAQGAGSQIMTSVDGINWTSRYSPQQNAWAAIAEGNGAFVSVSNTGTERIMTASSSDVLLDTYSYIPEITTYSEVVNPLISQLHYRWRNDIGTESTASYITNEDTAVTNEVELGTRLRLRVLISNTLGNATGYTYKLEHASSSCSAWIPVPTTASTNPHWIMDTSSNVLDSEVTTDSSGLSNPAGTFSPGYVMTQLNQTPGISLTSGQFTEIEYSIRSTSSVSAGTVYCFRLTNAGLTTGFTYTAQPQISIPVFANRVQSGGSSIELNGSGPIVPGGTPSGGLPDGGTGPIVPGGTPSGGSDTGFINNSRWFTFLHRFIRIGNQLFSFEYLY